MEDRMWVWDEISGEVKPLSAEHALDEAVPEEPDWQDRDNHTWMAQHIVDLPDGTRIVIEMDGRAHTAVLVYQPPIWTIAVGHRDDNPDEAAIWNYCGTWKGAKADLLEWINEGADPEDQYTEEDIDNDSDYWWAINNAGLVYDTMTKPDLDDYTGFAR